MHNLVFRGQDLILIVSRQVLQNFKFLNFRYLMLSQQSISFFVPYPNFTFNTIFCHLKLKLIPQMTSTFSINLKRISEQLLISILIWFQIEFIIPKYLSF